MPVRVVDQAKEVVRRQEDSLQLTKPRRLTNHAGTGLRGNVDMVTSATSGMTLIYSIQPRTLSHHRQKAAPALLHDDSDVDEPPFMIASNVVKKKVKFSPQNDEVHVYEKKDYVKSSRKSQTYPKGHGELGRTTDEVRKDEQWAYSCRLARSRGKAMAIILDEKYDYSDIDEVLIIVGPTLDIMIRIEYEDDDVTREVFTENYVHTH